MQVSCIESKRFWSSGVSSGMSSQSETTEVPSLIGQRICTVLSVAAERIALQRAAGQLEASQGKDGGATAQQAVWARAIADAAEVVRPNREVAPAPTLTIAPERASVESTPAPAPASAPSTGGAD